MLFEHTHINNMDVLEFRKREVLKDFTSQATGTT